MVTDDSDRVRQPRERPALRRDAAENRTRMLAAAARAFAEHGLAAGMEDIARLAGVGPATLYRRFPTKDLLVSELVAAFYDKLVVLADEASEQPPGTGLELFLRAVGRHIANSRGFLPRTWGECARPEQERRLRELTTGLLVEAQQAGLVNDQLTLTDVGMIVWGMRGVIETTGSIAPDAWQRHLDLVMAGLRAERVAFSQPPLNTRQMDRVVTRG
ncbi:TetR/AcrR family transcriptional regulator [Streptomyces sp. NPDC126933]|uniref:TetR/AcrR family transcriptional regulator n=1 Tax=unclassified Streptomyces TaxID=2593676 RepID=UPI0036523530